MTYAGNTSSIQDSQPLDLFEFTNALGQVTRYTNSVEDVVFDGNTYTAKTVSRGSLVIDTITASIGMTISLPCNDAVVAAYCGVGIAPQKFKIAIRRINASTGSEQVFSGFVSSCDLDAKHAQFTVVRADDDLDSSVPAWVVSRLCQVTLFDERCRVDRASFVFEPTIVSISGTTIVLSTVSTFTGEALVYGELLHLASGERRWVTAQDGTEITIDNRLPTTAQVGDTLRVWRGCDKRVTTCRDVFDNVPNFRGAPHLITSNPWLFDLRRVEEA